MNYLYLLSEDDNDDVFYERCLSKITHKRYEVISRRLRKGGGTSELNKKLPIMLRQIKQTGTVDNTFFLVAKDNDRSPIHPEHERRADFSKLPVADQKKACRYCEIDAIVKSALGSDRAAWPIQGAIAIPVEMIETWQLLICNADQYKQEHLLPIFPNKKKSAAKEYYASSNVPNQLKDLVKQVRIELDMTPSEFCHYCGEQLDVEDLKKRSPSFALFATQVANW